MTPKVTQVMIERLQLAATHAIPSDWFAVRRGVKLYNALLANMDAMVFTLVTCVNKTSRSVEVRTTDVPLTAWDHAKQDWFPSTLAKWFGVRHATIRESTTSNFLCPHVDFGGQDPKVHVAFMSQANHSMEEPS